MEQLVLLLFYISSINNLTLIISEKNGGLGRSLLNFFLVDFKVGIWFLNQLSLALGDYLNLLLFSLTLYFLVFPNPFVYCLAARAGKKILS